MAASMMASNVTLSKPANFTPPKQTSQLYLIARLTYNTDNNLATWSATLNSSIVSYRICYPKLDFNIMHRIVMDNGMSE